MVDGILLVLGDTQDVDFPIYRSAGPDASGDDTDTGYTLTTALFSVQYGDNINNEDKEHGQGHSSVTLYMSNPHTNKRVHITKPLRIE